MLIVDSRLTDAFSTSTGGLVEAASTEVAAPADDSNLNLSRKPPSVPGRARTWRWRSTKTPRRAKPRTVDAKSIAAETIVHSERSSQLDHADSIAPRMTRTTTRGRDRIIKTAGTGLVAGTGTMDAPGMDSTGRSGGVVVDKAGDREGHLSSFSVAITAKSEGFSVGKSYQSKTD
jgi:hypothetical protein